MRQVTSLLFCLLSLSVATYADAQTLIDPSRRTNWSLAGAGSIPNRTTICATLNPGATAAQINTAIANCPSGQVVFLNAGTFTLTSGLVFNGKSNVTLRGNGPNSTFLNINGNNSCGGKSAMICVRSSSTLDPDNPGNTANWTAGYTQGTASITLSSTANLQVGSILALNQLSDNGSADPGNDVYVCTTNPACTQNGGGGTGIRPQVQWTKVTSISGSTVGITPPLMMPNWRSAKSPQAYWSTGLPVTGVGLEGFSLQYTSSPNAPFAISFFTATNSWVKNVRTVNAASPAGFGKHVLLFTSAFNTIRDSYFFGCGNGGSCANDNYGVDSYLAGSNLIENNIFQRHEVPMMNEQGSSGNVFAYNFTINNRFQSNSSIQTEWMQASAHDHGAGNNYGLYESNDGNGTVRELYFGLAHFFTDFRNRWAGWEPTGILSNQSVAVHNYARARFHNYIGNVLGTEGYHVKYQAVPGDSSNCNLSVYAIGLGGNCEDGGGSFPTNDTNTLPSLMRWGNWDTVTNSSRFVASEVPSGLSRYANAVPSSQALPASLYLSARPGWWPTNIPWPAIGPDIAGGNIPNVGGHAYTIPARVCFESVMGGTFFDTNARTFNANNCYANGTTPNPIPMPPPGISLQ